LIFNQIDESKIARARADVKAIQTAIMMFKKDTGCFPNRTAGADGLTNTIQVLVSDGSLVSNIGTTNWNGASSPLLSHLRTNDVGYPAATWKGPYLPDASPDPWGNAYMVGVKNFDDTVAGAPNAVGAVWVISAGPNGTIETGINDDTLSGDDIGIRIR